MHLKKHLQDKKINSCFIQALNMILVSDSASSSLPHYTGPATEWTFSRACT